MGHYAVLLQVLWIAAVPMRLRAAHKQQLPSTSLTQQQEPSAALQTAQMRALQPQQTLRTQEQKECWQPAAPLQSVLLLQQDLTASARQMAGPLATQLH
jgi:hypothetical protein